MAENDEKMSRQTQIVECCSKQLLCTQNHQDHKRTRRGGTGL